MYIIHSEVYSRHRISPSEAAYVFHNNTLSLSYQGTIHSMTKASDTEIRDTVDGNVYDLCWMVRAARMSVAVQMHII